MRALLEHQNAETAWQAACAQHQQANQRLVETPQRQGVILADDAFFSREHGKRHQATPWFSPSTQRLRDEVFISAMAIHRAFIDAAAKPLRHNLGALMNVFTTQTLRGPRETGVATGPVGLAFPCSAVDLNDICFCQQNARQTAT